MKWFKDIQLRYGVSCVFVVNYKNDLQWYLDYLSSIGLPEITLLDGKMKIK